MDMGLEPWHLWVSIALCLLIGEVFVSGFVLASLGLGALHGCTGPSAYRGYGLGCG